MGEGEEGRDAGLARDRGGPVLPAGPAARAARCSRMPSACTCVLASLSTWGRRHPPTMFLSSLTSQLLRVVPRAGKRSRGGRWARYARG